MRVRAGLVEVEGEADTQAESLCVPVRRADPVSTPTLGDPDPEVEGVAPPLLLPREERDTEGLEDSDTLEEGVKGMEAVRVVDLVRVAPPPRGSPREGEGVVLCEAVAGREALALGQAEVVMVMGMVGVRRGVEVSEALALGEAVALVAVACAEAWEEGESLVEAVVVRVTCAGVAEVRALAEKEALTVEVFEALAEVLSLLRVGLRVEVTEREVEAEGARLTESVTERVRVSL